MSKTVFIAMSAVVQLMFDSISTEVAAGVKFICDAILSFCSTIYFHIYFAGKASFFTRVYVLLCSQSTTVCCCRVITLCKLFTLVVLWSFNTAFHPSVVGK